MTARIIDPAEVARAYRDGIRGEVAALESPLTLVGFLSEDGGPSRTYASYTRKGCEDVGIRFDLRKVTRLQAEAAIEAANEDPDVHGMLVYYPVFGTQQDTYLRDLVEPRKDIEGLHSFWARCLYGNRRTYDDGKKAILPCTPLAILKLLDAAGASTTDADQPYAGKRVVIFNRSEVVGRPLASMLANDGAEVTSFDIDGPLRFVPRGTEVGHAVEETSVTRGEALSAADVVITGVPSRSFALVAAHELRPGVVAVNFSTLKNFADAAKEVASSFVPRVGPMTVAMALRHTLRLYLDRD